MNKHAPDKNIHMNITLIPISSSTTVIQYTTKTDKVLINMFNGATVLVGASYY